MSKRGTAADKPGSRTLLWAWLYAKTGYRTLISNAGKGITGVTIGHLELRIGIHLLASKQRRLSLKVKCQETCPEKASKNLGEAGPSKTGLGFVLAGPCATAEPLHVTAQKIENLLHHKFTGDSFPRSQTSKFSNESPDQVAHHVSRVGREGTCIPKTTGFYRLRSSCRRSSSCAATATMPTTDQHALDPRVPATLPRTEPSRHEPPGTNDGESEEYRGKATAGVLGRGHSRSSGNTALSPQMNRIGTARGRWWPTPEHHLDNTLHLLRFWPTRLRPRSSGLAQKPRKRRQDRANPLTDPLRGHACDGKTPS